MKKYLVLLLFGYVCWGQSPVKSLYTDDIEISNAYYKDTHNDLDKLVGTWKYTNGSTILTITLQKRTMFHNVGKSYIDFYEDLLIGEYKYVENGVEKVNTLPLLNANYTDLYEHNIVGNLIAGPHSQYCLNCSGNDRKIILMFFEPNREIRGYTPQMMFYRYNEGGVQKMKLNFRTISSYTTVDGNLPIYTLYSIPFGEYILTKQP